MNANRPANAPARIAAAYLLLLVVLFVNQSLYQTGLPSFSASTLTAYEPWGLQWLDRFALMSSFVLVYLLLRGGMSRPSQILAWFTFSFFFVPSISNLVLNGVLHRPSLSWGIILATTAAAATLLPSRVVGRAVIMGGGFWGYANLMVGLLVATGLSSMPILDPDPRYSTWLQVLGASDSSSWGALGGLGADRQMLGATLALFLVVQVRVLTAKLHYFNVWTEILFVIGVSLALLWTLSRTSLIAVVVGLVVAHLPWRRMGAARATSLLATGLSLLAVVPLTGLFISAPGGAGTWQWRVDLWSQLFQRPLFLSPFGLGPTQVLPLGATHSHNAVVEITFMAGLLGLLVAGLYLVFVTYVAVSCSSRDSSIAVAVVTTFVMLGQTEMPLNFRSASLTSQAIFALIILGASLGQRGLPRIPAYPALSVNAPRKLTLSPRENTGPQETTPRKRTARLPR